METKGVKALFMECDERNDVASRAERRNQLNDFKHRVGDWIAELDARGPGPTAKEMVMIITDLDEHLAAMRENGRDEIV